MQWLIKKWQENIAACGISLTLCTCAPAAFADSFPSHPITINVGYGPGDNADLTIRALASTASHYLGQPVVVVDRPGAAGAVALTSVKQRSPDGYQLAAVLDTPLDRLPALRPVDYKIADFEPVLQYAAGPTGVVVKADSPWKTLPELIQYAKVNPNKVSYTTTGAGTSMDVAFQYIAQRAGVKWTHVPYPNAQEGLTAVLGGHVTAVVAAPQWASQVRNGSARLLAVIGEKRMTAFPDVPTLRELGYDFTATGIYVLLAPKGTPAPVIARLNDAFQKAMSDPHYLQLLNQLYMQPTYRSSAELVPYLNHAATDFSKLVKDLNIPTSLSSQ